MKVVTYNIQFSRGKDGRYDLGRIAREVEGADVIALQEVERHWPRSGLRDQPAELGGILGAYYWVYGPSFDMDATETAADGRIVNRRRQFGDMLLSKTPILSSRLHNLPKTHHPDRFNMHMGALEGVIEVGGRALRVFSIHLGYLDDPERREQLEFLLAALHRSAAEQGAWSGPGDIGGDDWTAGDAPPPMPAATLWMGDFNLIPQSAEYDLIVGRGGFVDSCTAAGGDPAGGATIDLPAAPGDPPGQRIDYVFATGDLAACVRGAWVDSGADGSDHQPYWVELDL